MQITLKGKPEAKMAYHQGIYSKSYQDAKANWEAERKNWEISIEKPFYKIVDSKENVNIVSSYKNIFNCSCDHFIENASGSCQHISAIKIALRDNLEFRLEARSQLKDKINQLNFDYGEWDTKYDIDSPAIQKYVEYKNSIDLGYDNREWNNLNVFEGIELFDHQNFSCRRMLRNKKTVLTLKMGLGKTLCAMTCCKLLDAKRVIIICPSSLKYQWEKEIARVGLGSAIVLKSKKDVPLYKNQKFLIVNYEFLNFHPYLLDEKYDVAILDEIQKVKNKESKTWTNISKVTCDYLFALSGTVIQNNVSDLISVINILNKNEINPDWKFYSEYCKTTRSRVLGINPNKLKDLKEKVLDRYIVNPVIDYNKFTLPKANYKTIEVKLDDDQLKASNDYYDMAQMLLAKSMNYPLTFAEKARLNGYLTNSRLAAVSSTLLTGVESYSSRIAAIQDLILSILPKKILIYSDWIKSSNLLKPFLAANGIQYVDFNGSITTKKRDENLRKFIEDPKIRVMLSTDSGGLGVDGFQFICHNVLHIEPTWNPAKISQRNGRLVRAFQKAPEVNIYNVISDAAIEELVLSGNLRKNNLVKDIFEN